jgi:hypothetical protein
MFVFSVIVTDKSLVLNKDISISESTWKVILMVQKINLTLLRVRNRYKTEM